MCNTRYNIIIVIYIAFLVFSFNQIIFSHFSSKPFIDSDDVIASKPSANNTKYTRVRAIIVNNHTQRSFAIYFLFLNVIPYNTNVNPQSTIITNIINPPNFLSKQITLTLLPSHDGIDGNERADLAVKQATDEINIETIYSNIKQRYNG